MSGGSPQLIEQSIIDRLVGMAERSRDRTFLPSVIAIFTLHTPPLIESIAQACEAADRLGVKRLAHRLKGSSLSMGGAGLAAQCIELEALCDLELFPVKEGRSIILRLRETYEATALYFQNLARQLPRHDA